MARYKTRYPRYLTKWVGNVNCDLDSRSYENGRKITLTRPGRFFRHPNLSLCDSLGPAGM